MSPGSAALASSSMQLAAGKNPSWTRGPGTRPELTALQRGVLLGLGSYLLLTEPVWGLSAQHVTTHTSSLVDFFAGISHILYTCLPMVTVGIIFAQAGGNRERLRVGTLVGLAFLFTHLIGVAGYLVAPGVGHLEQYYSHNLSIFGMMPVLYAGYLAAAAIALLIYGLRRLSGVVGAFALFVGFAAVYLQHQYTLDVIAGAFCALGGSLLAQMAVNRCWPHETNRPSVRWDHASPEISVPGKGV